MQTAPGAINSFKFIFSYFHQTLDCSCQIWLMCSKTSFQIFKSFVWFVTGGGASRILKRVCSCALVLLCSPRLPAGHLSDYWINTSLSKSLRISQFSISLLTSEIKMSVVYQHFEHLEHLEHFEHFENFEHVEHFEHFEHWALSSPMFTCWIWKPLLSIKDMLVGSGVKL